MEIAKKHLKSGLIYDAETKQFLTIEQIIKALKAFQVKVDFYPHQARGVEWMIGRERNFNGGILADDPGLGKTIQVMGLLCHSLKQNPSGKTLIILPQSLIDQWYDEIKTKSNIKSVYQYHGTKQGIIPEDANVILTTYNTVLWDCKKETSVLHKISWERIICDEAHIIRNSKTKSFQAIKALRYKYAWAVTGTPVMNAIKDIYSLVELCKIEIPFEARVARKDKWIENMQQVDPRTLIRWREENILRRTKNILSLPSLYHHPIKLKFNDDERLEYLSVTSDAESAFQAWARSFDRTIAEYSLILVQILRLRQCCDHRYLKHMGGVSTDTCVLCGETMIDEMGKETKSNSICKHHPICVVCAPKQLNECYICKTTAPTETNLRSTKVDALFDILKTTASNNKSVVFSQWRGMLDIIEKRCEIEGIKCVRMDGSMAQKQRHEVIQQFKSDPEIRVFVLSTRVGGVGLNLTEAQYVFSMDPWWNPFVEEQANDRVYRIGQTKDVHLYSFTIQGSIEEWLEMLKEKKRELSKIIIGDQSFAKGSSNGLQKNELQGLMDFLRTNRFFL